MAQKSVLAQSRTFNPRAKKASPLHFRRRRLCINRTRGSPNTDAPSLLLMNMADYSAEAAKSQS